MVKDLVSVIKFGSVELEVPNGLSVAEAKEHYEQHYPELAFAELEEPVVKGDKYVYNAVKSKKVGTKG